MKTQKNFIKRLVYSKQTISNLSYDDMNNINGGFIGNDFCPPPPLSTAGALSSIGCLLNASSYECINLRRLVTCF